MYNKVVGKAGGHIFTKASDLIVYDCARTTIVLWIWFVVVCNSQ